MELKELIVHQRPRENSGSRSSNRFNFQQDWVICKILELYELQDDFLILLDYHDDVVVLNKEEDPDELSFYQIKSKASGNWTMNSLINRPRGKNKSLPSILGKLYSCKLNFPKHTLSLNFVSNALFNIKLESKEQSTSKKEICFNQINRKDLDNVVDKLMEENSIEEQPNFIDITFLQVTDLNVNDRESYVRGKLSSFLEEINPQGKFRIGLIYRTIFDEVKRKTNYEYNIESFDDLLRHKSIGRSKFSNMLNNFDIDNKNGEMWAYSEKLLTKEGLSINETLDLKVAWNKYEVDKTDLSNKYLLLIREKIKNIVKLYRTNKKITQLNTQLLSPAYREFANKEPNCIYDEFYIKSIILMEFYEL